MAQATMRQVAERAGVSTALVSLVMRGAPNVSDHRRARVLAAAEELGYRPNVLARNLASRRTRTIGVVLNDLHNQFFAEIVDGLQDAADANGYRVLLGNGRHCRSGEADALETFLQFRVDGVIMTGSIMPVSVLETAAAATPIVIVSRTTRSTQLDTVNTDDVLGAQLAVEHLVGLGHRRIAHIGGGTGAGAAARRNGYRRAMKRHGLADHIAIANGDFSETGGQRAAAELLEGQPQHPTAIFAANDLSAVGALTTVAAAGCRVPEDMSIIGYDNTALAELGHLSMTTINQPRQQLGETAVRLLLDRLDHGRTEPVHDVLAPALVERATTCPPLAHPRETT